jgi:glyoxylase-like metal-dependent hydrolase (beta-lactamase superfamily II)
MREIKKDFWEISLRGVNAFAARDQEGWVLFDTGNPGDGRLISEQFHEAGFGTKSIHTILLTHMHPDHAGGLSELLADCNPEVWIHSEDNALLAQGRAMRPLRPRPGLWSSLLFQLFVAGSPEQITPYLEAKDLTDGQVLPYCGGIQSIHTPGHSAGHVSYLLPEMGVLVAGDAVMNQPSLNLHLGYEDYALGRRSAEKLLGLDFELAVFGHGKPLLHRAKEKFHRKFGPKKVQKQFA